MKLLLGLAAFLFTSTSFASVYKCGHDACTWSGGCTTYYEYFQIENGNVRHWNEMWDKDKVDYSDIKNAGKGSVASFDLEQQRLANGNYHVKADGLELLSENDKVTAKNDNIMYIEFEVFASLVMGRPKGRVIETHHVHHAKSPNKELKPRITIYKCNLVR